MANLIDNPTYVTFKRAVLNGWNWQTPITLSDVCREFRVSAAVGSAWLIRIEKDRQQEIAQKMKG